MQRVSPRGLCLALLVGLWPWSTLIAADKLDFNRDVRPILSDKCFACHGPDAKHVEGDLRIDLRDDAVQANAEGHAAIVPGKPEASEVVRRINSADSDERMPPEKSHKKLTAGEKELLARWITEGAEYKQHWAFVAPVRPAVPEVKVQKSGVRSQNAIDAFVADRLLREKLSLSPEADKTTLIRRVTLDLTGLPPTIAEVDEFLADTNDTAYEKVVDRLLASPHYGERMAMWWLDGARYADSNGYQADEERFMWRWRDWVIDAFNRNQPFDQFTIEQLAGDLLPNPTISQRIATGFNRNHRMTTEGGSIPEEWRIEGVIDRVETTSAVWMALTMGCARCHDHKYDPITQKELYQFFAFFNNVPESGMAAPPATPPFIRAPRPEDEHRLAELDQAIAAAESALRETEARPPQGQAEWEGEQGPRLLEQAKSWRVLAPQATSAGGATFSAQPDGCYLVSGATTAKDVYTLTTPFTGATTITGIQFDVLPHSTNAAQNFGRAGNGNIVLSEFEAEVIEAADPKGVPRQIKFASAVADYSQPNWVIASAIDGNLSTGWALDGNDPTKRADRHAVFMPDQPISLPQGGALTVRVRQETLENHNIGRFRLAISSAPGIAAANANPPAPLVIEALSTPVDKRSDAQRQALSDYFRNTANDSALTAGKAAVESARKAKVDFDNSLTTVMVMEEMPQPRDCFVLMRGQYDKPGDKVTASLPSALPPMPAGQPVNRLGLARWLVDPAHPLTARVQVNRYWELLFGVGLCKSSENFGMQSQFPSHPELLDWLATEYIRLGWDTKAILKTMVMSATYRQSSKALPQLIERDPDNRLLARGPRFRLQAEMVRDNALAICGLLVDKLGGPSVRPYQPEGIWDEMNVYGNLRNYKHDTGEGLYRRSMYTIWKRTSAPPNLLMFDMPGRELCVVRRARTNTPLQALSLLNEETYVEAARVLAQQMLMTGGGTPEDRIAFAFRRAMARAPSEHERQTLTKGLQRKLEKFRAAPDLARQFIAVGESQADPSLDPAELAAYTLTASVILNLDETITKE